MARRRVQYGVVDASDADVGGGAPGFRTTWHSKVDLREQLMEIDDVPKDGRLYFWDGELWLRWEALDDLPGTEQDPLRIKVVRPQNAGPLLTLRGLMQQPLAKMTRRLTDRASATKTRAVKPRTFSEVLPWHDFTPAALARPQELDDTTPLYMPQVYDPTGASENLISPADEAEVGPHFWIPEFAELCLLPMRPWA
ncbi:hypothetical protein ABBQ38_005989 [Trebouxia sp. C0009 RCD-2024]